MKLLRSFYYAFCGIMDCMKNEMNFRIHIVAMLSVIMFSSVYELPPHEKSILVILISLVMVGELINTSVEAIVDKVSPEKCENARIAKDSAAGAVLIFAISAVICAVFLFSNPEKWLENVLPFVVKYWYMLIVYVALSWFFIFKCGRKNLNKIRKADKG